MAEWYLPSSEEIKVSATRLGEWHPEVFDLWLDGVINRARAEGWDERGGARGSYLGPDQGHYEDCCGWEDCYCATYPNPYRTEEKV
jgi:hypothetical protein